MGKFKHGHLLTGHVLTGHLLAMYLLAISSRAPASEGVFQTCSIQRIRVPAVLHSCATRVPASEAVFQPYSRQGYCLSSLITLTTLCLTSLCVMVGLYASAWLTCDGELLNVYMFKHDSRSGQRMQVPTLIAAQ